MRGCRKQTFIPVVGRQRVAVEVAWKVACLSLLTCSLHPPLFSLPPHLEGGLLSVCIPNHFKCEHTACALVCVGTNNLIRVRTFCLALWFWSEVASHVCVRPPLAGYFPTAKKHLWVNKTSGATPQYITQFDGTNSQ